jgi:rod shape determining protein RodA
MIAGGGERRALQYFDWGFLAIVLVLLGMGIVNLISATYSDMGISDYVRRQMLSISLGGLGFLIALVIDYRKLEALAYPLFAATVVLTASTLVFGRMHQGNQSWLTFGSLSLQPSEFAKIGLILALSRYFHRNPPSEIRYLRNLIPPGLLVASLVAVIVLQRDKGVALLTLLISSTYLPLMRIRGRSWFGMGLVAIAALALLWFYGLDAYHHRRILDFIDPGRDPLASGYQVNQSRIAVGSGGIWGKGYLEGTQSQLKFLPTQHTDFIFSVLAEEWGFVGCGVVLVLYVSMLLWGLQIALKSKERFGALLAIGVVAILFWPAAINIAMVLGMAPVIGVALPLFSYGGSSMITSLVALGLLLNVSMRRYMF